MKLMLIHDGSARTRFLKEILQNINISVIDETDMLVGLCDRIKASQPDLVLIDMDAPSRDSLEAICVASRASDRPLVMFTGDGSRESMRKALSSGIAAYVVGDVEADRIQSLLLVAMERFELDKANREELDAVKSQLDERKWVDQAKGILQQTKNMDEPTAHKWLRDRAMQTQRRIGAVARELVEVSSWLK